MTPSIASASRLAVFLSRLPPPLARAALWCAAHWQRLVGAVLAAVGLLLLVSVTLRPPVLSSVVVQYLLLIVALAAALTLRNPVPVAALIIVVDLFVDWYRTIPVKPGFPFLYLVEAVALIAVLVVRRQQRHGQLRQSLVSSFLSAFGSWPILALWGALLALVLLDIPRSLDVRIAIIYAGQTYLSAFILWCLGNLLITRGSDLRQLLSLLALIGTVVGIHSAIEGATGVFLLALPQPGRFVADPLTQHFQLGSGGVIRAASFLLNPDTNGIFLVLFAFLALGLAVSSRAPWARIGFGLQVVLMLLGLVFTYTTAAWIAGVVGLGVFLLTAVRPRQRLYTALALGALAVFFVLVLPHQAQQLAKHATTPREIQLREAIWQSGLRVVASAPLTGVGLGTGLPYITRSRPYWVPALDIAPPHPHNSFIEIAAFAGLPTLVVYVALLLWLLVRVMRNYRLADWELRPLISGVLAALAALTVQGLADATWTSPALVPIAWLLLGGISSVVLRRTLISVAAKPPSQPAQREQSSESSSPSVGVSGMGAR